MMLLLPYDMWDGHGSIINSDTKIIDRLPIAPHNYKISKCIQVPTNLQNTSKQS